MDILSIVTLIALAIAMGMVVITARLLRDERRRSDARVAALTAAARDNATATDTPERAATERDATVIRPPRLPKAAEWPARVDARPGDDLDLYPSDRQLDDRRLDAPVVIRAPLFGAHQRSDSGPRRLVPVLAVGTFVIAAAIAFVVWSSPRAAITSSVARHTEAAPASNPPPLELVALRHRRDGARLAISGIVKNPSGAAAIKNVSAVVFLFDQNGMFLSSGRAPIDFTTLTPGDESPFVVVVNEPGAVARYRVSFRSDDHVVPHVDRREPGTSNAPPAVSRTRAMDGSREAGLME